MNLALVEAEQALAAGEFPVGCIITCRGEIVARGRKQKSRQQERNELDHAEIMALRDLNTHHPDIDPASLTIYSTLEPCLMCLGAIMINQIGNIVYAYEDALGGGTSLDRDKLPPLYREMELEIIPHIQRRQSLELFRQFFQQPENNYLDNTYLAQYTLEQP